MKAEVDTQPRKDPAAPFLIYGEGSVVPARVAEERSRVLGQELTDGGRMLARGTGEPGEGRELDEWQQF